MCPEFIFQKIRAGEVPGADPSWDNRGEALRRNHALFNALPDREKMKLAREAQSLTAPYSVAHKASDTAALANKLNSLRKKENQCTLEGMPGGGGWNEFCTASFDFVFRKRKMKDKMDTRKN